MLLFNLNLDHVGWVLNDLVDIRLMRTPDLAHDTLSKIGEASNEPPLIERAIPKAGGYGVQWDHAINSVDRPCNEEDNEEMVSVPESLIIRSTRLFDGCEEHSHDRDGQNVTCPARARQKVKLDKAQKACVVLRRELRNIVQMRDSVDPGEEHQ